MKTTKLVLILMIAALIAVFFIFDLHNYLTLDALKSQQARIESYRSTHPVLAVVIYAVIYIAITSLSLPGAAILTLAGGGIFGIFWSTVIVSFVSTIGATLSFLAARFLLRDWVRLKLGNRLKSFEDGVYRDGAYYLFTLRLVPIFPFFLINLAMGLTSMKAWTFYWVSQAGMLAGTMVYVNACLLYTSPSPRDGLLSRMPSSA